MDMAQYNKMKKDFVLQFGNTTITAVNAGVITQKLRQLSSGFVYETVTTPSDMPGKFDTVQTSHWFSYHKFELLDDLLEENQHENTLIFYQYKEELAELQRRYPKSQTLDDKDAVARWNAGKIPLLLAHPDSAQYGLNLQHGGSSVVFLSLPWSLTNFEQAYGRLHRSGQRHEVRVYCLLTRKTIDEQVLSALNDKKSLSEIAIDALKSD
jgi:SNF2 family DNA or RNA helicase